MDPLFHLETERVALSWSALRARDSAAKAGGLLRVVAHRRGLVFETSTRRSGVPLGTASDPSVTAGPCLFEQVDYKLYARGKAGCTVRIDHRDPNMQHDLASEESERVVHGIVNFRSDIGRSHFTVLVNGEPEFSFEVEVFPSKLDYVNDYNAILADVQAILTGLALEYLRSTYTFGSQVRGSQPTELEWVLLLRHVVDDLERALRYISRHPIRKLERRTASVRVERVQRVDARVRAALRRGAGSGSTVNTGYGFQVRERLPEQRPSLTLDTPEHRWLSAQLRQILRGLATLRSTAAAQSSSERRGAAIREVAEMEARVARLAMIEPLAGAFGEPPAGFASLQLLGAPGYKEAYQACIVLSLGLRIEGGPLHLSVKDLSTLYEYWCYLATLRVLAELPGHTVDTKELFRVKAAGLQVRLMRGAHAEVRVHGPGGRRIAVRLGPSIDADHVLVPQEPDVLISIDDPGWPQLNLVLDAKYRLDTTPEYVRRYGAPGPPDDALNILHRYRDAIVELRRVAQTTPKRTVVQAVAAFPYTEVGSGDFAKSRLWKSVERMGIGAIPLLPNGTQYLEAWLTASLTRGAWGLTDRAIRYVSDDKAADWRRAATESVLVGILRGQDPRSHLEWIKSQRLYYAPITKTQRRQFTARWVAIYSPAHLRKVGAVTHMARIVAIEVVARRAVATPWAFTRDPDEMVALYHLEDMNELPRPIENRDLHGGGGQRVSVRRWSSRLAIERAQVLGELALETEPEWRLYEDLNACGAEFWIEAGPARVEDLDDPTGRAWFYGHEWRVRYSGASGFELREDNRVDERYFAQVSEVVDAVKAADVDEPSR